MKRVIYLSVLTVLFGLGLFFYYRMEYPKLPKEINALNKRIEAKNEKLISAQILASELSMVADLIDRNLAISRQDSLAEDASLPFLEDLTSLLEIHGITLVRLAPDRHTQSRHDYVKTSYKAEIGCTYKEFGQFINDLEKSNRLISLEKFEVNNLPSQVGKSQSDMPWDHHIFEMTISTLTLIKHSS
jgi:Tfp pilus assembly protein PilO